MKTKYHSARDFVENYKDEYCKPNGDSRSLYDRCGDMGSLSIIEQSFQCHWLKMVQEKLKRLYYHLENHKHTQLTMELEEWEGYFDRKRKIN